MIQIFFNKNAECYEAYLNGQKIDTISIRVDSENMNIPKATITAFIEVVNEQPVKEVTTPRKIGIIETTSGRMKV